MVMWIHQPPHFSILKDLPRSARFQLQTDVHHNRPGFLVNEPSPLHLTLENLCGYRLLFCIRGCLGVVVVEIGRGTLEAGTLLAVLRNPLPDEVFLLAVFGYSVGHRGRECKPSRGLDLFPALQSPAQYPRAFFAELRWEALILGVGETWFVDESII